jgi:hypothetical protein
VGRGKETSKSGGATWASYSWFVLWYLASPHFVSPFFDKNPRTQKTAETLHHNTTTVFNLFSFSLVWKKMNMGWG